MLILLFNLFFWFGFFRNDDIFEESMCRFYVGEMTQAIHALHCMGYVHR